MTDREMLELAAKAYGCVKWEESHGCYWTEFGHGIPIKPWAPLEDDGDALRLAVKLRIDIELRDGTASARWIDGRGNPSKCPDYLSVPISNDPYAATRRAIVRAAAEIGKAMP